MRAAKWLQGFDPPSLIFIHDIVSVSSSLTSDCELAGRLEPKGCWVAVMKTHLQGGVAWLEGGETICDRWQTAAQSGAGGGGGASF